MRHSQIVKDVAEALKKGGYCAAVVIYEGSGDSGQIDEVYIFAEGEEVGIHQGYHGVPSRSSDQSVAVGLQRDAFLDETRFIVDAKEDSFDHEKEEWVVNDVKREVSLRQRIEDIAYLHLEAEHGGWEINEGSYGYLVLTLTEKGATLRMEHSERVIEVNTHEHTWSDDDDSQSDNDDVG